MAQETELKLRLAARDLPRLLAHPRLTAGEPVRRRLAVRERRVGRRTLLTVKTAGTTLGGLSRRGEWEGPTTPGRFDFAALVDDPELADWLDARRESLVPVFRTDFTRLAWTLALDGARVEVALDRGAIHSGHGSQARRCPLLELELELQHGPEAALYTLAHELGADVALYPATASKAERGYALFLGRGDGPVAAPAVAAGGDTPVQAFGSVARAALGALQANLAGWHAGGRDAEYVHQARVALRRLRAALRLFAPALPGPFAADWRARWRDLAALLGPVRDADVFATEVWPALAPAGTPLPGPLRRADAAARRALAQSLARPDWAAQLRDFGAALGTLAPAAPPGTPSLPAFARERLRARTRRLRRALDATDPGDPGTLHALRLEVKKTRYTIEMLGDRPGRRRGRRAAARLPVLRRAQALLGQLNDLAVARTRLAPVPDSPLAQALDHAQTRAARRLPAVRRALDQALPRRR